MLINMFGMEHESITIDEDEHNLIYMFIDAEILVFDTSLLKGKKMFVHVRLP